MNKYKLILAYDGTHYGGWQVQPNAPSIQGCLQEALSTILQTETLLIGSGRTDAGVHALAQVAHFTTTQSINPRKLLHSLNGLLPKAIRVLQLELAPQEFHARYSAQRKIYHYHLHTSPFLDPFARLYATHHPYRLDQTVLKSVLQLFVGTHDFSSFAHEAAHGSAAKNPIRTLYRIDLIEELHSIRLEFEGNGFLYKMVRNLVGTALDTASGKFTLEEVSKLFQARDRRLAGKTAPPQGLFLAQVIY